MASGLEHRLRDSVYVYKSGSYEFNRWIFLAFSMVLATLLVIFVALLFRFSGTESDFQLTHHQVCLSIAVKGDMALGPGK